METIFDESYLPNSNIFVYVDYLFWKFGPDNSLYVGVLGGGPLQCRVFGLYQLDVSSTFSVMIIKNVCSHH